MKPLAQHMGTRKGFRIDYDDEGVYIVFDLKVKKIFQERPKKGEEPVDENGDVIKTPVDRKGYFPEDIAATFGVPMEEVRREAEQLNMTGFVNMGDFTAEANSQNEATLDAQGEAEQAEPNADNAAETPTE